MNQEKREFIAMKDVYIIYNGEIISIEKALQESQAVAVNLTISLIKGYWKYNSDASFEDWLYELTAEKVLEGNKELTI